VHLRLADTALDSTTDVYGLLDEGSSAGLGRKGYGTMFGQVIGATVGQGTGVGGMPGVGTVVIGPSTIRGSGKATLWTKPGLYGVTSDAWSDSAEFDAAVLGDDVFAVAGAAADRGKLTTTGVGDTVARALGLVSDKSLVSTTASYAGLGTPQVEHCALYLLGVGV